MSDKIDLPDYLKGIAADTAADMITSGSSAPRISLKGRQFRFKADGEEIHKQTEPIHIIILGVVPEQGMAKTFYLNGYQPGSTDPPDCSSFFGEIPDTWCSSPQSTFCKDCEHQVWGSATSMSGSKSKACKDSKRLMVINAKDAKEEEPMVFLLNVTIASLKALSIYGKFLISNSLPMAAVITEVAFVDSDFPQVEFTFKAVLAEEVGRPMLERASNKEWMADKPKLPAPSAGAPAQLTNNQVGIGDTPPPPSDKDMPAMSGSDIIDQW